MHYSIRHKQHSLKSVIQKSALTISGLAFAAVLAVSGGTASAAAPAFGLEPFTFDPGNACPGIEAKWDNSTGNPAPSIKLTKPCPTATVAASGVDIITALEGQPVSNLKELNYDFKNDEHCGAGAPRFNIQTDQGTVITLGCASAPKTPTADPNYTHVEYGPSDITAALVAAGINPVTATLQDLYIIFDEGNDQPPSPGLIHIDNISVNNAVVGDPSPAKDQCKNGGYKNLVGANGQHFKNQGDCVSYFSTGGKNLPDGAI